MPLFSVVMGNTEKNKQVSKIGAIFLKLLSCHIQVQMSLRKKTSERFGGGCWKRIHSKKEEEEERTRLRSVGGKVGGSESTHSSFFLPCPKHRPARPTMPYDTDKNVFLPRKRVFWPKIRLKFHIFLCLNIIRANLWGQRPETSSLPFSRDGPCVGGRGKRRRRPMTHTRTHTHEVQGRGNRTRQPAQE